MLQRQQRNRDGGPKQRETTYPHCPDAAVHEIFLQVGMSCTLPRTKQAIGNTLPNKPP